MKVTFPVLILFSSLTPHALLAQNDTIFLRNTPLTYLGIDFSKLRYFGDPGTVSGVEMKEQSRAINFLVVRESNKYGVSYLDLTIPEFFAQWRDKSKAE